MGASGIERTPCGRIPNTPLRNARHEIIVHAVVCGKTARAAGIDAGFKDGPSLDGNVTRILHRPEVRERLTEVAASRGLRAYTALGSLATSSLVPKAISRVSFAVMRTAILNSTATGCRFLIFVPRLKNRCAPLRRVCPTSWGALVAGAFEG
jgi:hypothetical protein